MELEKRRYAYNKAKKLVERTMGAAALQIAKEVLAITENSFRRFLIESLDNGTIDETQLTLSEKALVNPEMFL